MDDVDNLFDLDSDPEVMLYVTSGIGTPREDIRTDFLPRYLQNYEQYPGFGIWAVVERSSGSFIGWLQFRPPGDDPTEVELGYRLKKAAWGKGYASEGSRALVERGFSEFGVRRVVAYAVAVNTASRRVMENAGLRYIRTFRSDWPFKIPGDVEYALTREEWEQTCMRSMTE